MVVAVVMMALAVFAAIVVRLNAQKREEIRVPLYIENLRARRRRR